MRTIFLSWTLTTLALLGLAERTSFAGTKILNPIADTFLRDQFASVTNFGNVSPLLVGIAKEPYFIQNRTLLKFDFSEIPTNATITGVTLAVVVTRSNTDPSNFDVNRMLVSWAELEATWIERESGVPWASEGCEPGTEYVSSPSVTAEIDGTLFSSAGMIADVQMWVKDPGTNFGWIVIATGDQVATGKMIGSRESEFAPTLAVDFIVSSPSPPPPPRLFGMKTDGEGLGFSFHAEPNQPYIVESRESLASGSWNLLTNIPAEPLERVITITNAPSAFQGFFRVYLPGPVN
ncbi:MAG TPA: DNRLRE domain-containing protein [Verrucomicrobiae bacterium]|nr:DNRLRE domain-containing protein [Verrucomicrobiae bacterium]